MAAVSVLAIPVAAEGPVPYPYPATSSQAELYQRGHSSTWTESDSNCLLPCDSLDACFCTRPDCYLGSASLEIVALERLGRPDPHNLFYVDNPVTVGLDLDNPVGHAGQLDLSTKVGMRFDLIVPSKCGCDLNLNVLAVHDSRASLTRDDADVFFSFFSFSPVTLAPSYTAEYDSDLGSLELNLRTRQSRRLAPLAGFRVLLLEENFNIVETGTTSGMFSATDNGLFGIQFGMQGLLIEWRQLRLEASCKLGAYHNDIDLSATAANGQIRECFSHIAFVGDLQLTATYQVGPRLFLHMGYQGLWLEGVALGPNQTDNGSLVTGRASIDLGTAIYQGGFLGGELTY